MVKQQNQGVAIYGIHPGSFTVDVIFMKPSNLGTSGIYLHEATYRTDMVELVQIPLHLLETEDGNRIIADLKAKALIMKNEAEALQK